MGVGLIEKVRALDSMTVEFKFSEPFPEFLRYMTQEDAPGAQSLISPAAIRKLGPDGCADKAPGTGAFRFHSRFETDGGSAVELRRNDDYWAGSYLFLTARLASGHWLRGRWMSPIA